MFCSVLLVRSSVAAVRRRRPLCLRSSGGQIYQNQKTLQQIGNYFTGKSSDAILVTYASDNRPVVYTRFICGAMPSIAYSHDFGRRTFRPLEGILSALWTAYFLRFWGHTFCTFEIVFSALLRSYFGIFGRRSTARALCFFYWK